MLKQKPVIFLCSRERTWSHTTHTETHRGSFLEFLLEHSGQTNLDICTFVFCSFSAAGIAAVHGQAHKKEHTCALRHEKIDISVHIRTFALTETHIELCCSASYSPLLPRVQNSHTEKAGKARIPHRPEQHLWDMSIPLDCAFQGLLLVLAYIPSFPALFYLIFYKSMDFKKTIILLSWQQQKK